jgi:DNA-binding XRE family transcriptional regulator
MAFDFACLLGAHRALESLPLVVACRAPDDADALAELAAEVGAFVAHLHELVDQGVMPEGSYARHHVAKAFEVWESWLADPAHPRVDRLTWLREWVATTGEFHVQEEGFDPVKGERVLGIDLLNRMIAMAAPRRALTLRELRKARKLSQDAVAAAVGVTKTTVWRWEHFKETPSPKHMDQLTELFGVEPGGYEGHSPPLHGNVLSLNFDRVVADIIPKLPWTKP